MNHYEEMEMEVIYFDAEDVIATSLRDEDEGETVRPTNQP